MTTKMCDKINKKKVLVLAPHQDDEIDLAAYALLNLKEWDKYILYSTNGDYKTPAEIRFKEAIAAAAILGVPKTNIIFLGYGDNQEDSTCIFFSTNKPVVSASGHTETYGALGINDYHFQKYGVHSPYTYMAFKEDLKEVILDIRADLIICVDFDSHIDHRMLSLAFDEVMQDILSNPSNLYIPEVWKRFGYTMSFFAPEDYTPFNNKENVFPPTYSLKQGELNLIGKSLFQWNSRIRIPEDGNTGLFIWSHTIVRALNCHVSQYALFRAFRMDNSDEVFWRKRTDNKALQASVITSSGNGKRINDFKMYDTDEIGNVMCSYNGDTWLPTDRSPVIVFKWDNTIRVKRIIMYGSVLGNGYTGKISIECNKERFIRYIDVCNKPEIIDFECTISVRELTIRFLSDFSTKTGIAEIEIFENEEFRGKVSNIPIINSMHSSNTSTLLWLSPIIKMMDKTWLRLMRLRAYSINYYRLLKSNGFKSIVERIYRRIIG